MDIAKSPQFQLYMITWMLFNLRYDLIPEGCDFRCIDSTIINRAYYSSYLYTVLWLLMTHGHKLKSKKEFPKGTKFVTEHAQVRDALKLYGEEYLSAYLTSLVKLRNKADYYPDEKLDSNAVDKAVSYMESIFQRLDI